MGVRIYRDDCEPIQVTLRRFKKAQEQSGFWWGIRQKQYFISRTQKRRAKKFKKRFKAREQALLAELALKSSKEKRTALIAQFWQNSGKP